jgi:hypothetical protein
MIKVWTYLSEKPSCFDAQKWALIPSSRVLRIQQVVREEHETLHTEITTTGFWPFKKTRTNTNVKTIPEKLNTVAFFKWDDVYCVEEVEDK